MERIEKGEKEKERKDRKTERYMVSREDVIMALMQERDCLFEDVERERETMPVVKSLYKQAGFTGAIEAVKKVRGEWK